MEVSLTQIFDRPLRGREFFEEIIRDNLDLGRPDRVQLIFDRVVTKKTPGEFRTRVIQEGVHPSLHINYKNFDLKQYFKEGRGCRTEGTFRSIAFAFLRIRMFGEPGQDEFHGLRVVEACLQPLSSRTLPAAIRILGHSFDRTSLGRQWGYTVDCVREGPQIA